MGWAPHDRSLVLDPGTPWSSAAFSDDVDDCNASSDHPRAIQGCTALINGGKLNRRNAIRAFENRASAYAETGDFDAAIY